MPHTGLYCCNCWPCTLRNGPVHIDHHGAVLYFPTQHHFKHCATHCQNTAWPISCTVLIQSIRWSQVTGYLCLPKCHRCPTQRRWVTKPFYGFKIQPFLGVDWLKNLILSWNWGESTRKMGNLGCSTLYINPPVLVVMTWLVFEICSYLIRNRICEYCKLSLCSTIPNDKQNTHLHWAEVSRVVVQNHKILVPAEKKSRSQPQP